MKPQPGDLRVFWVPQVPGKALYISVKDLHQAHLLLETLAYYDAFQYASNIKPDYCNAGGLQVFEDGEWCDWHDDETGDDFDMYCDENPFPEVFSDNFKNKLWQCIKLKEKFHSGK